VEYEEKAKRGDVRNIERRIVEIRVFAIFIINSIIN
jgi:hypothetical protein